MKSKSKKTTFNKKTTEKKDMNQNKKAQVSIEMIVILGILILGAVILATFLLGVFGEKTEQITDLNDVAEGTFDNFLNNLGSSPEGSFPQEPTPIPTSYNLTLTPNNPSFGSGNTSGSYQAGSLVTVIATPNAGYSFNNWTVTSTGVVASSSASYSFTMPSNNLALTANFSAVAPTTYTLSLVENPNEPNATLLGSGNYSTGSTVSISINNTGPINFINWTDGSGNIISSNQSFNYTMPSANTTLTANFNLAPPITYLLSVNKTGTGSGNVVASTVGIDCGSTCSYSYNQGSLVTLNATANAGSSFSGWSGAGCSGTGTCIVTMDAAKTVTATFNPPVVNYLLSVNKTGTGSGNVVASTVGIDCGSTCSYSYNQGTMVNLNATANAGSSFSGWSGAGCSGTGTCIVTMDAAKSVIATFSPVVVYSEFISTWDTTKTSTGSSASNQITLPLVSTGVYDFNVDWGDGSKSVVTSWNDSDKTHTYSTSGVKTIKITGTIKGFRFNTSGDRLKLINISKWGPLNLGNDGAYFSGANNLTITATDILDLNGTTNLMNAFSGCIYMSTIPSINDWNVSAVDYMDAMFYNSYSFNQSLDKWDVSNVKSMSYMFSFAYNFNQPLNNWNVLNVTNMTGMFQNATSFNQPLNNWNVSNVTNMSSMFSNATLFDQSLNNWNVSNVTDMSYLFSGAVSFNQPLNNWNVSKVTTMKAMFSGNTITGESSFNQNINNWSVFNVIDMSSMFMSASNFNQPLDNWGVWNVTDMSAMFFGASSFNQPLNNWNVLKVRTMRSMFYQASSFNQPLNNWNVSEVINMQDMFNSASSFNQPLNNWNVSKVATMYRMFNNATLFNQDLSSWNVSGISNYIGISNTSLSVENYTKLLIAWSQNTSLKNNVRLDVGSTRYDNSALSARNILRTTYNWSITDGGMQ